MTPEQLFDLATIGMWVMETEECAYVYWSREMLSDPVVSNALRGETESQQQTLWQAYNLSKMMLAGAYLYKAGARDFDTWRRELGDDEGRPPTDAFPLFRKVYELASEAAAHVARGEEGEEDILAAFASMPLSRSPDDPPYSTTHYTVRVKGRFGVRYFLCETEEQVQKVAEQIVLTMGPDEVMRSIRVICPGDVE